MKPPFVTLGLALSIALTLGVAEEGLGLTDGRIILRQDCTSAENIVHCSVFFLFRDSGTGLFACTAENCNGE